ncbi:MAG: ParB/RepB/Spo0J family partition protein [Verrucomicrobiota bacterium]
MGKQALGKGLGALINKGDQSTPSRATEGASEAADNQVQRIELSRITPSPLQPRKSFREEVLNELVESIRQHGVIQPLILRRVDGKLELIAGERRFRASKLVGVAEVPAIIREASDQDVLEMALIENLQREDLNPVEEAQAYVRLAKEFGLRQEDIAKRVGKKRTTVANSMRLIELEASVQDLLASGLISVGHAKVILGLKSDEHQPVVADLVVRKKLTVRATEAVVADFNDAKGGTRRGARNGLGTASQLPPALASVQSRLRDHLSTQVRIQHGEKKGRIEIEYYGSSDLNRLLDFLGLADEDY